MQHPVCQSATSLLAHFKSYGLLKSKFTDLPHATFYWAVAFQSWREKSGGSIQWQQHAHMHAYICIYRNTVIFNLSKTAHICISGVIVNIQKTRSNPTRFCLSYIATAHRFSPQTKNSVTLSPQEESLTLRLGKLSIPVGTQRGGVVCTEIACSPKLGWCTFAQLRYFEDQHTVSHSCCRRMNSCSCRLASTLKSRIHRTFRWPEIIPDQRRSQTMTLQDTVTPALLINEATSNASYCDLTDSHNRRPWPSLH